MSDPAVKLEIGEPAAFAPFLARIHTLVVSGGDVNPRTLKDLLASSQTIAFSHAGERVVAVGAIKGIREAYNRGIANKSKYKLAPSMPELGYVITDPEFRKRGLARALLTALLATVATDVYAVARENNLAISRLLTELGFSKEGTRWKSARASGQSLRLWVRHQPSSSS